MPVKSAPKDTTPESHTQDTVYKLSEELELALNDLCVVTRLILQHLGERKKVSHGQHDLRVDDNGRHPKCSKNPDQSTS